MPRTTQCQKCGVVLNLPERATAGKRVRCPKCGFKFTITLEDASSESTLGAPLDAEPQTSTYELPSRRGGTDDVPIVVATTDLRETFDLPLMSARDAEREGAAPASAVSDAASLFQDEPAPRRRGTSGDARSRARRCSNCGGVVPQGMSICMTCGTDQETGMRVGFEDDLVPPPPPPPSGPPIHIAVVGGLLGVAALGSLILSLANTVRGAEGWEVYGWYCLAMVSGFGLFAVVQFIRLKTVKLLMVALTLGVAVDLLALIVMPLAQANFAPPDQVVERNVESDLAVDPDDPGVRFKSFEERFDSRKFSMGVTILVFYAVLSIYLMSPLVKKPIQRAHAAASW